MTFRAVFRDPLRDVLRDVLGGDNPLAPYAVDGINPDLVIAPGDEFYWADGQARTPTEMSTNAMTAPATMVDSDGLLKWSPHNYVLNSASPATQSITVVSGVDYTVECTGSGSVTLSGAGTGTVSAGSPVEVTASTTSLTITVSGSVDTMWAYRSDLGGMVNNPATGDSYVPTAGSAVFLPRIGDHRWNGSAWVDPAVLCEPAATNSLPYSNPVGSTGWTLGTFTLTSTSESDPFGGSSASLLTQGGGGGGQSIRQGIIDFDGTVTYSVYTKRGDRDFVFIGNSTTGGAILSEGAFFNVSTGSVGTVGASVSNHGIEELPGGWFRIFITVPILAAATNTFLVTHANADGSTVSSGGGQTYFYGAQAEQGSVPTSYIQTNGATVTRPADPFPIPSGLGYWSATGGSIAFDGQMTYADQGAAGQQTLALLQTDANNRIAIDLDTDGADTGQIQFRQEVGGVEHTVASSGTAFAPGTNVSFSIASRHSADNLNGAIGGTALTENAGPSSIADLSAQNLTFGSTLTGPIRIATVRVFTGVHLTDAQLEEATS